MNPIHDNNGNLIAVEMHNTRISAEALAQMAARVAALEAQIALALRDNTRLIARIVDLEHARRRATRHALWYRAGAREARRITNELLRDRSAAMGALHERDQAMLVVAQAVSILSRAEGLAAQLHGPVSGYITEAQVRALATALAPYRGEVAPPRAQEPGRLCDHCGLPLISAHIADEVIIASGERRARVHRVCASAYPGWTVVVTARGGV